MIDWIYWYFIVAPMCGHEESSWSMINMGMGKINHCDNCGKCLEII